MGARGVWKGRMQGAYGKSLTSSQFFCEPKTPLKGLHENQYSLLDKRKIKRLNWLETIRE